MSLRTQLPRILALLLALAALLGGPKKSADQRLDILTLLTKFERESLG